MTQSPSGLDPLEDNLVKMYQSIINEKRKRDNIPDEQFVMYKESFLLAKRLVELGYPKSQPMTNYLPINPDFYNKLKIWGDNTP